MVLDLLDPANIGAFGAGNILLWIRKRLQGRQAKALQCVRQYAKGFKEGKREGMARTRWQSKIRHMTNKAVK
jgi:hypothetical protein